MAITPVIHQWPEAVAPINQIFYAPSASISGGMTLTGAMNENPSPGGRAKMLFVFSVLATRESNEAMSWLSSMMGNGAIFSVPIYNSVQLVPDADIFGVAADNFTDTADPYSAIPIRRWEPFVPVAANALDGVVTFTANMSELGRVLRAGHAIGFRSGAYDFAHAVKAITYDAGNIATITVEPPLRRPITTGDKMHLRPKMLATVENASEVMQPFTHGRHMTPSPARFVEALV